VRAVFVAADGDADADTAAVVGERVKAVFPQVGYAVGRGFGGAVVRNRLRRRMREVVRQCAPDLPRGRYLVRLDPAAAGIPAGAFRAHVAEALQRAARAGAGAGTGQEPPTPVSR
jgi:ribonuclease P protein component